ncbi:MAG: acetyltransferase [Pseudomonadota bacterium]|nr:acetyltransferase [Pseudomonadota bacterium]
MDNYPVNILGAGGHAKVLIEALQVSGIDIYGITDPNTKLHGTSILGVNILGSDELVIQQSVDSVTLVVGFGSTQSSARRAAIYEKFIGLAFTFFTIKHPNATISPNSQISNGAQVMAGALIQAGSKIGLNTIINSGAIVDHDCNIGSHSHVAPGCVIGGGVFIGDRSHIGAGATIIQSVRVGSGVTIGAGATVINDVRDGAKVAGNPAREL